AVTAACCSRALPDALPICSHKICTKFERSSCSTFCGVTSEFAPIVGREKWPHSSRCWERITKSDTKRRTPKVEKRPCFKGRLLADRKSTRLNSSHVKISYA